MPLLDPLSSTAESLKKHGVIPDVIPETFFPSVLFTVNWGNLEVLLGNELTREITQNEPSIRLTPVGVVENDDKNVPSYTLAMLDPDAPSRDDSKYGPFRHWVISGLKPPTPSEIAAAASVEKELLAEDPDPLPASKTKVAITPYRPPGPGPGTGMHRYVFLLFQEPSEGLVISSDAPEFGTDKEGRRCWSVLDFAERHNLTLVGANFFTLSAD